MKARKTLLVLSICLLLTIGFNSAGYTAESGYPSKPIQIIVAHPAGGVFDIFFRMVGEELTKHWKTPVAVVNQTKGMGAVAADTVVNAKKDGYTLLGMNIGLLAAMTAAKPEGPINLVRDYEPLLADISLSAVLLAVNGDSKFKKLKDVINYAKEKPGELICATNTRGTEGYLQWELLKRVAKVNVTTLVLQGSKEILPQLLGGHITLGSFAETTAEPQIKAGRLRGLVIDEKSAKLPEVPTYAEEGYPEVKMPFSVTLLGPKGLPPAILKSWDSSLKVVLKDHNFLSALNKAGINTNFESNQQKLRDLFREEIEKRKQFTPTELGWK